ncbi:MAG: precorrin-3B C(17)-methyltransferase [Deltaproteobacteria bacterium]
MSARVSGSLRVIGLGPAGAEWRTQEAERALAAAQHVLGYHTYLARLPALPAATLHGSDNGDELSRARHALELTAGGARVVVVSGGDAGVFGMAAAVFEAVELGPPSWRALDIAVLPGVTAMLAAAARLGAPLGNDFCAINLSDNLKPWSLIERRLELAAQAGFVIALYNPASRARSEQLQSAFELLRRHRPHSAVVVFARAVGRPEENLLVTTLGEADPARADMQTLILIGNHTTRSISRPAAPPWVYTPRRVDEAP